MKKSRATAPQVHIDATLHVDQQGCPCGSFCSMASDSFESRPKYLNLLFVVGAVRVRAHSAQRASRQVRCWNSSSSLSSIGRTPRGAARSRVLDELQYYENSSASPSRPAAIGAVGKQQFDHRPEVFEASISEAVAEVGHHVLADFLGNPRRLLDPGLHQRIAAPEAANGPHPSGNCPGRAARTPWSPRASLACKLLAVRRQVFQQFSVVFEFDRHGSPQIIGRARHREPARVTRWAQPPRIAQKNVLTAASSASRMSGSSVIGRTSATRQAASGFTPLAIRLPA